MITGGCLTYPQACLREQVDVKNRKFPHKIKERWLACFMKSHVWSTRPTSLWGVYNLVGLSRCWKTKMPPPFFWQFNSQFLPSWTVFSIFPVFSYPTQGRGSYRSMFDPTKNYWNDTFQQHSRLCFYEFHDWRGGFIWWMTLEFWIPGQTLCFGREVICNYWQPITCVLAVRFIKHNYPLRVEISNRLWFLVKVVKNYFKNGYFTICGKSPKCVFCGKSQIQQHTGSQWRWSLQIIQEDNCVRTWKICKIMIIYQDLYTCTYSLIEWLAHLARKTSTKSNT